MPFTMKNETYYRTSEACQKAGISRSTLLRWLSKGVVKDASHRDIRGWRLFTQADINKIDELAKIAENQEVEKIKAEFKEIVPEYKPT